MKNVSLRPWIQAATLLAGVLGAGFAAAGGEYTPPSHRGHPAAAAAADGQAVGRVMVRFRQGASELPNRPRILASRYPAPGPQAAAVLSARHAMLLSDGRMMDPRTQVLVAKGMDSAALRQRLLADPDVESVWIDGRRFAAGTIPNDSLYPAIGTPATVTNDRVQAGQWYLRAPDSTSVSSIDAETAWKITWGDPSIVVADIDTGIRPEHPDLQGKVLPGYDMITDKFVANDGDGRDANPTDPGDWVTTDDLHQSECKDGSVGNSSWHGTQTAGIIAAATDNGIGMAGTGRDVMLLPVRVLGKCGGYDSDIIAGMRWAAGLDVSGVPVNPHPARVLNLSLGGTDTTGTGCHDNGYDAVLTELATHNVLAVVAAGNESVAVDIPAKCAGALGVAALRNAGDKVGFSNLGPEVAVSAPGGNCGSTDPTLPCLYPILTTYNAGLTVAGPSGYTGSFGELSLGTSFSTPLVSGVAALMLSANPSLTNDQVIKMIKGTARPFPTTGGSVGTPICTAPSSTLQDECYCTTSTCGAGMLDAGAAVALAAGVTGVSVDVVPSTATPLVGTPVTLDGSSATASAGASIASYAWSITGGGSIASFTGATDGPFATLATTHTGVVSVELVVTDNLGKVGKSFRDLHVTSPAPNAAITSTATLVAGKTATFDGSASTAVSPATVTGYQWSLANGDTAATISGSATSPTVTLSGAAKGQVTLTLTVTDSFGATASTSQVVYVEAAPVSGGGGGGFGIAACLSLGLAIVALRRPARAGARRRA